MSESACAALSALFADTGLLVPALAVLVAGLMRGFAGFGSAMLMAPIFAVLFGSMDMVLTVVAIELGVSLQLFPKIRREVVWPTVLPMSAAACVAMPFGVWLLQNVDKALVVKAVSGIVLAFVVATLAGLRWRGRRGPVPSAIVGAVSGAMMSSTSVGGPPVLMYLLSGTDPPATIRANIVAYYFLTHFLLIALVLGAGAAGWQALARAAVLFPLMVLGAWIGSRLFDPGAERLYRNVTLAILAATGLFGVLR